MLSDVKTLTALPTKFAGAVLIQVPAYGDERGFFKETYVKSKYRALGIEDAFVQDSVSFSGRNVLRGLHADLRMSKLVQVLRGEVFDAIVDCRRGSDTFGQWEGFRLSAESHTQLYVPAGFLHGFLTLTDNVIFCYKQGAEYQPSSEIGVRWDDPTLAVAWPLREPPRVSPKDAANGSFAAAFPRS
jgi:dTDP-4-dehydrorhamnose 3,5-epimerase